MATTIYNVKSDIEFRKENLFDRPRDSLRTPVFFLIQLRRFNYAYI